jgi:pyruvate/2-oxoglutarate dehydrogenase complex dihydrolipoamide dehydrogenase (E3) component
MSGHGAIVLGAGPGGYLAAERLAAAGRKVLLVEKARLGGACLKLVADAATGRVLGVRAVGAYASELIGGAAALLEQELRVSDVKQIVFPHPTVCEAIREAAWEMPTGS